jgi:hypothetical protein
VRSGEAAGYYMKSLTFYLDFDRKYNALYNYISHCFRKVKALKADISVELFFLLSFFLINLPTRELRVSMKT